MIRGLTTAVVLLAALWAGWWFVAANLAGRGVEGLVSDLRAQGWQVDYSDISTRGFPSRIDMTATDLFLSGPGRVATWESDWLQVFALSYRPNEIILAWPGEQRITLPDQVLTLGAEALMASATIGIATDAPLRQAVVQSGLLTLSSDAGWRMGATRLLAALRETPAPDGSGVQPGSYDLYAELSELALPGTMAAPDTTATLRLEATLHLDRSLALGVAPLVEEITLDDIRADWGAASFTLSGSLTPDAAGYAEGTVMIGLRNWPALLDAALQIGLIRPEDAEGWQRGLMLAASGDNSLDAPVVASGGVLLLGGLVPVGPAPRLRP